MRQHTRYDSEPHAAAMPDDAFFAEKEVHLRDYLLILRKRQSVVATTFIIIATFVLVITFSTTPQYEATAKLLIEKSESNPLLTDYGIAGRDPEFLSTQAEIIKSTPVGLKVVEMLGLATTYANCFNHPDTGFSLAGIRHALADWAKNAVITGLQVIGLARADAVTDTEADVLARAEEIARQISEDISVRPARDSRIVTLNYLSPNPVLAASIVNSVAKAYIDKTFDMKMESSGYTLKWMTEKADEERLKVEKSERALQKYMQDNDIVTMENKVTITPQKLAEINNHAMGIQAQRKELELVYDRVRQLPADLKGAESIQVIAADLAVQSLRNQILEAEKRIMDLSKTYGPKHPLMNQATADLEVLKQQWRNEIRRVIESVRNQYELIRDSEQEYQNLLDETKQDAARLNEKLIQYNILKLEVDTNQQLYNSLLTKIKEQNVAEQAQSVKVWVVEKAKIPEDAAKPNKKRNLLLGFVLALAGGVGLAFFLDYLDNTFKYPDDVEDRFGLPVLGTVAKLEPADALPEKQVLEKPAAPFSENFKTIRTAVLLSSADAPPKHLLVTSMSPEEGKTTSVTNLAISMAQADKKVLLIDADMRKPRIHKVFELTNDNGLSNYLARASERIHIRQAVVGNLDIITAGPIPPNPSELLLSRRITELFQKLEKHYDLILVDSPPILTVSDGLTISKLVEGTVLIARAGKTPYDVFAKGLRTLETMGAKIIGVILNAIDLKKSTYYYYYNRYYSAYYQEEDKKE